ncbi:hypothetical protein BGW39_011566 [Mortierella sp. 14UC]|nr:hypothetical protein BGW39_011566 [Mortierella sp. 14UC]
MVFLDRYETSFWAYVRGQGATVLLVNGTVLLLIVALASALDPYPHDPVWVTVCYGVFVLLGAWVGTLVIYQCKKTKARHIVTMTNPITLRTSQDWSWNDACIYVPPPSLPPQAVTRG